MSQRNWRTSSRRRGRQQTSSSSYASAGPTSSTSGAGGASSSRPSYALGSVDEGAVAVTTGLDTLMEELVSTERTGADLDIPPAPAREAPSAAPPQQPKPAFASSSSPFGHPSSSPHQRLLNKPSHDSSTNDDHDDDDDTEDAASIASTAVTGVTAFREAEGPTIYATRDRDDLSQITSSLAGNTVGSSAYYFGGAGVGGGGGGGGGGTIASSTLSQRRGSGGRNIAQGSRARAGGEREEDGAAAIRADLEELENGGPGIGIRNIGGVGGGGAASVAQSVDGLDYILSAGRNHNSTGNKANTVAGGAPDHIDVGGGRGGRSTAVAGGSVYSRRRGSAGGGSGLPMPDINDIGRGSGTGSVSQHSYGSGSRYVPSRAYQSQPSLCTSIQSALPPPIAGILAQIVRVTEPCWIPARSMCCTLRNSLLSGGRSPRNANSKKDDSARHLGSAAAVNDDDYFSKIMSPAFEAAPSSSSAASVVSVQSQQQQRTNQILYILRMLVAGALCGVAFLGLERVMMDDRRIPRGPQAGMMVDEYGRAMNNFRERRGVNAANHVRGGVGGMAHHTNTGNEDSGLGGGVTDLNGAADSQQADGEMKVNKVADEVLAEEGLELANPNGKAGAGGAAEKMEDLEYADGMGGKQGWVEIPPQLNNLADVDEVPVHKDDLPYYWHIPRTGGATMNDILGGCLRLTIASDAGGRQGHDKDEFLKEVEFPSKVKYVNVDTSNGPGIQRAKSLGLVESGIADVFVTSLLYDGASVFDPNHRARLFTIFRHPVHRAVSLFHFIQDTVWRRQATFDKVLSKISIEEYYKGGMGESNWMTRFLANEHVSELDEGHLEVAKEIIRRKCLVGLMSEKSDSFARFEAYFGWKIRTESERECHDKKLNWAWPLKHRHDDVEEGTELWNLVAQHNKFDVALYEYAEQLYKEQGKMFTA